MWRGLYTAGAGMIQETQRTDTIANNLANVNTTGYKRDVAVSSEFEPMLIRRINDKDMRSDVTSFKGFSLGGNPPVVGTLGLGSEIAEIATMDAISFILRPEKSTVPIQLGRSSWLAVSIFETKFS